MELDKPKRRRTLKIADAELLEMKRKFEASKEQIRKLKQENEHLLMRLNSYIDKDDSLLSTSQLSSHPSNDDEEEDESIIDTTNPSNDSNHLLIPPAPTTLMSQESTNIECTPLSQELSQLSEIGSKSQLENVVAFFENKEPIIPSSDEEAAAKALLERYKKGHHVVRVGVGVLVTDHENHPGCILIGERKGSHGAGKLALPGGHLEMTESWASCAARELREETDVDVPESCFKFLDVTNDVMPESNRHYVTIFMSVNIKDKPGLVFNMEPEKCEGWTWQRYDELKTPSLFERLFTPMQSLIQSCTKNHDLLLLSSLR